MSKNHVLEPYTSAVQSEISRLFVKDPEFHANLIEAIHKCFHLPAKGINRLDKATIILHTLFNQCSREKGTSFDLKGFLQTLEIKPTETKAFLSAVLSGIYFGDIDLRLEPLPTQLEMFLYQILAETISHKSLKQVLEKSTLSLHLRLVAFAINFYREGSYPLLLTLEEIYSKDHHSLNALMLTFIKGMKQKYYDLDKAYALLNEVLEHNESSLKQIIDKLEDEAEKEVKNLHHLFFEVVKLMIDSPMNVVEEMQKIERDSGTELAGERSSDEQLAEFNRLNLKLRFADYLSQNFTVQDFCTFAKLFGLEGHVPYFQFKKVEFRGKKLIDKLGALYEIFSRPAALLRVSQSELAGYFSFIFSIFLHLHAYRRDSSKFVSGLDRLAFVLPTRNRNLSDLPWLQSFIQGLSSLILFLQEKGHSIKLKDFPVFILDQSESEQFKKNCRFIARLNKQYKSSIIPLSREQILGLAQKIGIDSFINTTGKGQLGYGGARNAEFLLTGVLKHAFHLGYKKPEEILTIDAGELKSLFQKHVLGPKADIIFMGDDDIELPFSKAFAYAAAAAELSNFYFLYHSYQIGRATKHGNATPNLQKLHDSPMEHFLFSRWDNTPVNTVLSDCITKPKIFLNVPYGSEEAQFELTLCLNNYFTQPSLHLAGTRYPKKTLPTHYLLGLEDQLKTFIPYALQITLIQVMLDPLSRYGTSIFPWNDPNPPEKKIACLKDAVEFAVGKKNELQKRFWTRIEELCTAGCPENSGLKAVMEILNQDVSALVKAYMKKQKLSAAEKRSLREIKKIYLVYQRDAKLFLEYVRCLCDQIHQTDTAKIADMLDRTKERLEKEHSLAFSEYPLTDALHRLSHVVGAGEFIDNLQRILALK